MFRQIHEKARIHLGYVTTKSHVSTSLGIDRESQINPNYSFHLAHGLLVQGVYIAIPRTVLYFAFSTLKPEECQVHFTTVLNTNNRT